MPYSFEKHRTRQASEFMRKRAENALRKCAVDYCNRKRFGLSHYCARHRADEYRNGHIYHGAIRRGEYRTELAEVHEFLAVNLNHRGIRKALDWLSWAITASFGASARREPLRRVCRWWREANVTPLDLLTELAAVFMFVQRNKHHKERFRTQRYIMTQIGAKCCLLAKNHSHELYGGQKRDVGAILLNRLLPLLVRIHCEIDKLEDKRRSIYNDFENALREPFERFEKSPNLKPANRVRW
jgi:hypothetical protein